MFPLKDSWSGSRYLHKWITSDGRDYRWQLGFKQVENWIKTFICRHYRQHKQLHRASEAPGHSRLHEVIGRSWHDPGSLSECLADNGCIVFLDSSAKAGTCSIFERPSVQVSTMHGSIDVSVWDDRVSANQTQVDAVRHNSPLDCHYPEQPLRQHNTRQDCDGSRAIIMDAGKQWLITVFFLWHKEKWA